MIDTNLASFDADVLAVSHQVPVLADFWAPWCGPCNVLGPLLEKLEAEAQGRIRLVKINADENAQLCAEYGVRSLPTVVAFVDGEPVDQFVGALRSIALRAQNGDPALKSAPHFAPRARLDETLAARKPILAWSEPEVAPGTPSLSEIGGS